MVKIRVLSYALASLAFASVMFLSCSGDSGTGSLDSGSEAWTPNVTGINILTSVFPSPKEQNPYSVENMNEIFKNFILENSSDIRVSDIPKLEANFLYVRFLPYGKEGEYELKTYDTSLVLFKHPMDYNEIREPVVYIDRTLPDSIVPYFAAVPVGYEFGPTPYEILQELFLTQPLEEDDEDDQEDSHFVRAKKSNRANKVISDYLESQGLTPSQLEATLLLNAGKRDLVEDETDRNGSLTRNALDMNDKVALGFLPSIKISRWRPSGTLKYRDEQEKKDVPLVGVKVTAGYFYYWRSSTTDGNGSFRSPERWTFKVDYKAFFERHQFLLQDGHSRSLFGDVLKIEKKNTKSAWNATFTGNQAIWCVVWTAARNYWYGNIYGLKRPRQKAWWNQSLEIYVHYKTTEKCPDEMGVYSLGPFHEHIRVRTYDCKNSKSRTHLQIYGTTIHEIAHSSHYWNTSLLRYQRLPTILKETYAKGIERYLAIKRYGTWGGSYDRPKGYTGLFEDLEDTSTRFAGTFDYCDRVSGITAPMAEEALFKSTSWNDLKKNLMRDYPDGTLNENGGRVSYTRADMDALFEYWLTGNTTENRRSCLELSSSSATLSSSSTQSSSSSALPSSSSVSPSSSSALPSSSSAPSSSSLAIADGDGPGPNFIDTRDGYAYKTTRIGTQIWMAENLRYNADGSKCGKPIAYLGEIVDENTEHCDKYGRIYNWNIAMSACPSGWRLPSNEEWMKMQEYIAIRHDGIVSGTDLYRVAEHLRDVNSNGKDTYGFAALSGSGFTQGGLFIRFETYPDGDSFWWTASTDEGDNSATIQVSANSRFYFWYRSVSKSEMIYIRCVTEVL